MSIYASLKALHEVALDQMADHLVKGDTEKYLAKRDVLLKTFSDTVDSNERLLQEIHKLKGME
jgi:hypothetical protein